jgi:tetratricopeptide (TPR) repeat protein
MLIFRFQRALVRIRGATGGYLGVGFMVGEREIVTCSHVVEDALKRAGLDALRINLPFIDEHAEFSVGRIVLQKPSDQEDITILELVDAPPRSDEIRPVRPLLVKREQISELNENHHYFLCIGVPTGRPEGASAEGQFQLDQATGLVQLVATSTTGFAVEGGFSGSPVWDRQLGGVVGMIQKYDLERSTRVALMVPVYKMVEVWGELEKRSLDPQSREYLVSRIADLREEQRRSLEPERFAALLRQLEERLAEWDPNAAKRKPGIEALAKEGIRRQTFAGARLADAGDLFKDRMQEQTLIRQLLADDATRLVSVIGRGGMGKTALVAKILRDLVGSFSGVVCLSRSSGIRFEQLFLSCAKMLGGDRERALLGVWKAGLIPPAEKIGSLLEALRPDRYLIVLDNLEDVLDDQGRPREEGLRLLFEQALLSGGVHLLITSRAPLDLDRQTRCYDRQVELLEGLPTADGVALLRELDPNGDCGLRDSPEADLARAVTVVRGMPRALEVIAGILAVNPDVRLADVTQNFYRREDVMDALTEENYRRMSAAERRVLEALAVFARPVQQVAVDYLLAPFEPGLEVSAIVRSLARTHMVVIDRDHGTHSLHPIDQEYLYSRLTDDATKELGAYTRRALERRAASFYSELRTAPETWKTIHDIEPQLAEFDHHIRAGDYGEACKVLASVDYEYLYKWGHYLRLIEMHGQLSGHLSDPGQLAYSWGSLGLVRFQLGQVAQAFDAYEQGLAVARAAHDFWNESICLARRGDAHSFSGQIPQAIEDFEAALEIERKFNRPRGEEWQMSNLGNAYRKIGQTERAITLYEQALKLADQIGDGRGRKFHLGNLGDAYVDLGQGERAIPLLEEALTMDREAGGRRAEEVRLNSLVRAYLSLGRIAEALQVGEMALSITREIQHRLDEGLTLVGLAWAALGAGQVERAGQYASAAVALGLPSFQRAQLVQGVVLLRQGDLAGAERSFMAAIASCRTLLERAEDFSEARYGLASALLGAAVSAPAWDVIEDRRGRLTAALEEYRRGLAGCAAPGLVRETRQVVEQICAAQVEGLQPVLAVLGG